MRFDDAEGKGMHDKWIEMFLVICMALFGVATFILTVGLVVGLLNGSICVEV